MGKSLEQRVTELEKLVKQMQENKAVKISKNLCVGDTFELVGMKWTILDITNAGYKCLAEKLKDSEFDKKSSNWSTSDLRSYLNTEFYGNLAETVGEDNIIPFERDLLSLDGQTEYGSCEDKVSLLGLDEYRKYRALIPNADYYWWLITPYSTPCNGYEKSVTVVCPSGRILRCNYYDCNCGVRPFCIFSSSIFESEE